MRLTPARRFALIALAIGQLVLPVLGIIADALTLPSAAQSRVHIESYADRFHRGHADDCAFCQLAGHARVPAPTAKSFFQQGAESTLQNPRAERAEPLAALTRHFSRAPPLS